MLISSKSMWMPKVGLPAFQNLGLGTPGGGEQFRMHFQGSELGSCCYLCLLFAKRMGRENILNQKGL